MEQILNEAQAKGVVVGLNSAGSVVDRVEIDEYLFKDPIGFNLYLLALNELHSQYDDKMGFGKIAGIHGFPLQPWDNVTPERKVWDRNPSGDTTLRAGWYCHHGLLSFPTWHRPYLAMMEQSIFKTMFDIAKKDFKNSRAYQDAVSRFRLPYWDPFRPRGGKVVFPGVGPGGKVSFPYDFKLPRILTEKNVVVLENESSTKLTTIPNPLYKFNYPSTGSVSADEWDELKDGGGFYDRWTSRWPQTPPYDKSDINILNDTLNRAREQNAKDLVKIMTESSYKDWRAFSNHGPSGTKRDSLEGFHDGYHSNLGGDHGHMSTVPIAAFDPVFWLHHCNIDRLLAIYQAINPSIWWPSRLQKSEPPSNAELYPFRKAAGNSRWWTSDDSKRTDAFGYSYSELKIGSPARTAEDFARRYTWSRDNPQVPAGMGKIDIDSSPVFLPDGSNVPSSLAPATTRNGAVTISTKTFARQTADQAPKTSSSSTEPAPNISSQPAQENPTLVAAPAQHQQQVPLSTASNPKIPDGATARREWYVDSEADRLALNGSFTVFFFVGAFDENPATYHLTPTLAGKAHFFIAPSEACENCFALGEAGAKVGQSTNITPILCDYIDQGQLASLEPDDVAPFLTENLKWRVIKSPEVAGGRVRGVDEGVPVPTDRISGFKIHANMSLLYTTEDSYVPVFVENVDYDERIVARVDNGY